MRLFIKFFLVIIFFIVILTPFNSLGAKSHFYQSNNLTAEEIEFLNTAYKDEVKCQYYFKKVMEKFPDAGFAKIFNSEQNHVTTLETIYNKYGLEIPKDMDFSALLIPSSLSEVCVIGLKFEKDNAEMYQKFLKTVTNTVLKTVFEDLRDITINRNIPAVEKCK
jgi:hypothetical protein